MVPDFYAMLGVDSGADRATIEASLARCQPVWSSGTRNPKNKHTFQSYLDQIPAIRRALLGDLTSRAAYDAELAASRRAEHDARLDELQRLVRLRAAKGGLTVSDRSLLRGEATRMGLANEHLDRLLEPYPPLPETPSEDDAPDPVVDTIDPATRRQIRLALEHLRRRDLYDVLDVARDAPAIEVAARADAERQKWMQKSQVTAEKTAWLEAVSYAQSHLVAPDARAKYDATLRLEIEDGFQASIAFAMKATTTLAPGTRQFLRDEAESLGIVRERADKLIDRACRVHGVSRDGTQASPTFNGLPTRYLRCRTCTGLTDFGSVAKLSGAAPCRHCGASLHWHCPVCQRSRWVDETRCVCGFLLENVEPLVRHFEAAQHAHRVRDFDEALAHLQKVQEYAPRHIGARKGVEKVKARLTEIAEARAIFEADRARRHLVAARASLVNWGRLIDPTSAELRHARDQLVEELRQALALVSRADALVATDPKAARALYIQSLAIATDLSEARDGLRKLPPEAPQDLQVEVVNERVRLRWTAPPNDGLGRPGVRIIRKIRGIPQHPEDGVVVAELAAVEWEDKTIPPGETVGYAAYALRAGVLSRTGSTCGPIVFLLDVKDLCAEPESREVTLSWVAPPQCLDVRVLRKKGTPPSGPDDGELIPATRTGATDRGLVDEQTYHYGVFARYKAAEGRIIAAKGAFVAAIPSSPVLAVVEPLLSREDDGRLRIAWDPVERGVVKVFRSPRRLPFNPGDRIPPAKLEGVEGIWLPRAAADHGFDDHPPEAGVIAYTPMISFAGSLTVGRSAMYSQVADPTDLRAVRSGKAGKVLLRWRWNPLASQVMVLARAGAFPIGPDDPLAEKSLVDEVLYSRFGSFSLTLPASEAGAWHVLVLSVTNVEGMSITSSGLEPTARTVVPGPHAEVSVAYTLQPPGFLGRIWTLTFRTDPPGSAIPPTALVAHPRTVPLSVDDGEIVCRLPAARDGESFPIRPTMDLGSQRARIFADPTAILEGSPPIRLRHSEADGTRV